MSESVPTLALHLRDSRCLRALRYGLYAVAVGAVFFLPARPAVGALWASTVLIACVGSRRRDRASLRTLEIRGDGRCRGMDRAGAVTEGLLGAGSLAMPGLVVLEIRTPRGRRRQVWLAGDAFHSDDQRRLRVRIRVAA